jgi:hypothetical protein
VAQERSGFTEDRDRIADFRRRMIEAHRLAYATKRRSLGHSRYLIADMLRESPRFITGDLERRTLDALFEAGCSDDSLRAIAEEYRLYIERRIAARERAIACRREALRTVLKEQGEAAVAQLVADQDPTPVNRERAERETRDVIRAAERYVMSIAHHARTLCRNVVTHAGEAHWR